MGPGTSCRNAANPMLLGEVHDMIRHLMQPDGVPDPVRHPMLKHGVKPGGDRLAGRRGLKSADEDIHPTRQPDRRL